MKRSRFLTLSALYLATHTALAEDATQKSNEQVSRTASIGADASASAQAADTLAAEFAGFVGSADSAAKLIDGLRAGVPVSLPTSSNDEVRAAEGDTAQEVRIVPPPQTLSLSDIHTALSLAQAQLKAKGVANPVPAEYLRSSLVGGKLPSAHGDMTRVIGILPLRQRGMKWEQIARALRLTLPAPWSAAQSRNSEGKS